MTAAVALVTGAARRLGAAIVRELHGGGYRIALHYRESERAARALADELNAVRDDSVRLFATDLADPGAPAVLAQQVLDGYGRCDLLVNNASAFLPSPLGSVDDELWDALMGSNLRGPFFLTQALAPVLREGGGAVVNLIDVHAERPLAGYAVYSMAKAALLMMTRALARELAPDVRVNGVSPGIILWPEEDAWADRAEAMLQRVPLQRLGEPRDVAAAVGWLAAQPYVTGQVLAVDGGMSVVA